MVDSEHLQITQIALSERRAPGGRAIDATSMLVMSLHPCQRRSSRTRITPGRAEVRFDNASCSGGSSVQTVRRFSGEHGIRC